MNHHKTEIRLFEMAVGLFAFKGNTLHCVEVYHVKLCNNEICGDSVQVNQTNPHFELKHLNPCSPYNISVNYLTSEGDDHEQVFPVPALSPTVEEAGLSLMPSIKAGKDGKDTISWNNITCSTSYKVFQLDADDDDGEWKLIKTTKGIELVFEAVNCREHQYGVKVDFAEDESEIIQAIRSRDQGQHDISNFTINCSLYKIC